MTGTNKLGLLLVLLDLAPENIDSEVSVSKRELANRYLDLHWEHGRPYGEVVLRQSSVNKKRNDGTFATDTTVMQQIHRLRDLLIEQGYGELNNRSFEIVRHQIRSTEWKDDWDNALEEAVVKIEGDLWKNPIRLLQNLNGKSAQFLFSTDRDGIRFLDNIAEVLTKFSGVLRPLIEFRFAEMVARINRECLNADEYHIHEHLFDQDRSMPPRAIREGLIELQENKCIFTERSLSLEPKSLDHVIPWSRTRLSVIENFIVTTRSTNSSKADSLLGPDLVNRWCSYMADKSQDIENLAREHRWPADFNRARNVALRIYKALHPTTGVWHGKHTGVQPLGVDGKRRVIESLRTG